MHFTTVLGVRRARSDERVVSRRDLPNLPCGKEKKKFYRGAAFSKSSGLSSSSQQIFSAAFLSSSSQQLFSAALLSSSSQQPFSAALLSSSSQQLFSAAFLSSSSQQLFSAAFLSSSYQQLFSAAFLSSLSQQLFSAAFLSSLSQQLFSAALLSRFSQQLFSAALLSSSSQQLFSAAFLSSSSQQLFSAIILLWSGVGGQLVTSSSAALLSSSSQQLFLLWSGVGGQLVTSSSAALLSYHLAVVRGWWSSRLPFLGYRSLEAPFRNAFGKKGWKRGRRCHRRSIRCMTESNSPGSPEQRSKSHESDRGKIVEEEPCFRPGKNCVSNSIPSYLNNIQLDKALDAFSLIDECLRHLERIPCSFNTFKAKSLRPCWLSRTVEGSATPRQPLWPIPPPLWGRWKGCNSPNPRKRHRLKQLEVQNKLLQHVVCMLNWIILGYHDSSSRGTGLR